MKRLLILGGCLLAGCTTERQWMSALSTTRFEYGQYNGGMDPDYGNKDYDADGYYIGVSIAPLAFLEQPKAVYSVPPPPVCPEPATAPPK